MSTFCNIFFTMVEFLLLVLLSYFDIHFSVLNILFSFNWIRVYGRVEMPLSCYFILFHHILLCVCVTFNISFQWKSKEINDKSWKIGFDYHRRNHKIVVMVANCETLFFNPISISYCTFVEFLQICMHFILQVFHFIFEI